MEKKRNKLWRKEQMKRVFKARMIYFASFERDYLDKEGVLHHSVHWFELAKLKWAQVYKTTGTPCSCPICQGVRYNRNNFKKDTLRILKESMD